MSRPDILFSETEIAARVNAMARTIASLPQRPEVMVGILAGAFVFAADLARALVRQGLPLPVEFVWLRSYGDVRTGGAIRVLVAPTDVVRGRHVLIVDGVLDRGATLAKAKELLFEHGASSVVTAVAIDKQRSDALLKADHAAFAGVRSFVVGYGMDDGGTGRALPYITRVD